MSSATRVLRKSQDAGLGVLALAALYVTSRHSYLLFHALAELFTIVIAATIFVIAWNARNLYENRYFLFLGIALAPVAGLAVLHTLAYKGMGVFPAYGADLATQLWVASRGLLSLSLLVAPLFVGRRVNTHLALAAYLAALGLILASIFVWRIFPVCYVERVGLTRFKIASEYVICAGFAAALVLLWRKQSRFDRTVLRFLTAGLIVIILAELAFTQYVSVYGTANLIGHLLTIVAFFLIYKAIVQTALARPFDLLFRELRQRERQLQASREMQEQMSDFIVHDLRSQLTGVLAGIEALRERSGQALSETDRQLADGALASGMWMLSLTNALLDCSRLEAGEMPLALRAADARELIAAAVEQVSSWAVLTEVAIRVDAPAQGLAVTADRELSLRTLVNLLHNAVKFSPPGSAVTVRAEPADGAVAFSVSDQGPGIRPEWTAKVFERFGQVKARQAGAPSSGLGLYFCRLAAEAQGGKIRLESKAGKGTTVTFTLPAASRA